LKDLQTLIQEGGIKKKRRLKSITALLFGSTLRYFHKLHIGIFIRKIFQEEGSAKERNPAVP
jgi:hypothetical protein